MRDKIFNENTTNKFMIIKTAVIFWWKNPIYNDKSIIDNSSQAFIIDNTPEDKSPNISNYLIN
jgi:hypothetical protein